MHGSQVLNTNPDYADRALPELQSLSLEKCNNLTDIDFKYIAALPKLQSLKLRSCCRITDECLTYISDMNGLQNLDLRGCKRISAEALATFMANHPGVEIIR